MPLATRGHESLTGCQRLAHNLQRGYGLGVLGFGLGTSTTGFHIAVTPLLCITYQLVAGAASCWLLSVAGDWGHSVAARKGRALCGVRSCGQQIAFADGEVLRFSRS